MNKLIKAIRHPRLVLAFLLAHFGGWLSDEFYLRCMFRLRLKKRLDLEHPQTFNEKLQWLKLYNRNPKYIQLVDKAAVKDYFAKTVGEQYLIPTLGIYDTVDEIDFDALPNQFVLKCTHDSGGMVFCRDKSQLDIPNAKKRLRDGLKRNYYKFNREWPYKHLKPRIIAEQYMVDESGYELKDYKFFCFDGVPKMIYVASDRGKTGEETKFDFFDMDFNRLPFTNGHPNSSHDFACPQGFEKMKELAETLSKGYPHIRVDFYDINGKVFLGELTFFHCSGVMPFDPEEWDYKLGEWLKLPDTKLYND